MKKRGINAFKSRNNKSISQTKRSQITIFIIIAVLIVVIIAVLLITYNQSKKLLGLSESEQVYSFIEDCIRYYGEGAIYQIGQTGGYYHVNFSTENNVSYYIYNGKDYSPSKENIELELSRYLDFNIDCDFREFKGYNITMGRARSVARIEDKEVIFKVTYPLTIKRGTRVDNYDNFNIEIPARLGLIYDTIKNINKNQSIGGVCLSCVYSEAKKNDFYIDMYDYNEDTVIFLINDKNSSIGGESYLYLFANRYKLK